MHLSIFILFFLFFSSFCYATGTVCIDAISTKGSWEGNTSGANKKSRFLISINNNTPQVISPFSGGKFKGLDLSKNHIVKILLNNKLYSSFKFNFNKKGSPHLKMWYYGMYGTWQLSIPEKKHKCFDKTKNKTSLKSNSKVFDRTI